MYGNGAAGSPNRRFRPAQSGGNHYVPKPSPLWPPGGGPDRPRRTRRRDRRTTGRTGMARSEAGTIHGLCDPEERRMDWAKTADAVTPAPARAIAHPSGGRRRPSVRQPAAPYIVPGLLSRFSKATGIPGRFACQGPSCLSRSSPSRKSGPCPMGGGRVCVYTAMCGPGAASQAVGMMGLRSRIMLSVAIGLVAATAPLGIMGLVVVQAATDRVLEERLATTRTVAAHLSERLVEGWAQLDRIASRAASNGDPRELFGDLAAGPPVGVLTGGIGVVDSRGRLLAGGALRSGRLLEAGAWVVREAIRTRQRRISPLVRARDAAGVLMVVPVRSSAGGAAGAGVGIVDLARPVLRNFVAGLAQGATGHAVVVDRDGTVLASTREEDLFTRSEHPEFLAQLITSGRSLVAPAEKISTPRGSRETHLMAFAPVAGVPWGVGVGQDDRETFGHLRRLRERPGRPDAPATWGRVARSVPREWRSEPRSGAVAQAQLLQDVRPVLGPDVPDAMDSFSAICWSDRPE